MILFNAPVPETAAGFDSKYKVETIGTFRVILRCTIASSRLLFTDVAAHYRK
jgi:hypothetical protein